MQKRMFKSEKGSITLFVLLAILFFLIVIFSVFMTSSNKNRIQLSELDKIKQEYEKDVENIDEIYEEVAAKELIQVAFDKNGDTYNIAKDGTVDISTNVSISYEEGMTIISREYGWSNSSEKEPTSWTSFAEDSITVTNKAQGQGSYYLWVRVKNNRDITNTTASNVFQVNENEIGLSKDINEYTKDKVTVTIDYKDTYVTNKKVGIGKTVDEAIKNAVANENTTVEVTENCFVYVTAEDAYGNVSSNYIEIDNIDAEAPMITLTPNGDEYVVRNNSTMQINVLVEVEDKVSGVKEVKYYWGTSNTEKPTDEQYTITENNKTVSSEQLGEGTYYLWVKATDNAGNVREEPSYAYIVRPPLAPEVSLKENNANGKEYTSGTWTNQDVYHEISLPTTDGTVGKYQYSTNGTTWKDYIEEDTTEKIDYTTTFPMTSENKPEWLGDVTANGDYYFDVDENGALTSDGEHGNKGIHSTTANSYIKLDLTSFTSEDLIKININANVSSQSSDYGYATITESETAPSYNSSTGRFIYISGTSSSATTAKDYSTTLTGGKIYYLHFGYRKSSSGNSGNDVFKINSIKLVNAKSETYTTTFPINNDGRPDWMGDLVSNGEYYFVENGNGGIKANNGDKQNLKSTTANSYIKLDLSEYTEDDILNIAVNAQISSESPDYGYATITESETAPAYNSSTGRFIYISGTSSSSTASKDYSTTLTGGKVYYLHFGYRKDSSVDSGEDNFTINSITLSSDTMLKPIEFYDYTLNENTATYTLKEDINKDFYVKAIYEDGTESSISQFRIQIDKTPPVIGNISSELISEIKLDLTVSDIKERGSGLKGYYISTEETVPTVDSNWTSVTENTFEIENLDVGTKYYIWLIDNANNISEAKEITEVNANYRIDNTKYSETLEQALSLANNNSSIELLNDYTDESTATIDKNIILNTGNYILTRTQTITINGGTEEEPITFELNGKVTSSSNIRTLTTNKYVTIRGTGIVENTSTSTSTSYSALYNSGILTQEGKLTIRGYYLGVYNSNIFILNSGKIENTRTTSGYAIYNYSSGDTVNINGGEVSGYYGIYNSSSSQINISEGEITGINDGIYISSGTANIDGGYISGIYGIYTGSSSGTVNVLSGMIVGSTYGIYGYTTGDGKITIGDINTEVNQVSPVVSGGQYGIYMRNNNSYNFYNGIIMGTNTKPYTDTVNPREGYMVYTYYDYNNARKYCAVLTTAVDEITIEQTPTNDIWTNQDVTIQVKYPILEGSTLQYSENGQDWETIESGNGHVAIVSENKKVYARMLDASGIVIQSKEHKITNIDKIVPVVTINPETTKYTIYDKEQTDVNISVTVNVSDEGGSGLKTSRYGWSNSKETKPTEWNDLSNGQTITKENCTIGTYYLWFDVSDNAGNVSDVEVIRYMVELQEAVAQIVETGEYYYTIQEAMEASGTAQSIIKIIKDTDEVSTIKEGQNITIDLNGHILGSSTSEQATFTNNGTLTIIDNSENKAGTIENFVGTAIENNGTLTIGDNTNAIDDNTPTISGKKTGIKNNNELNYYDGTIIGKSAIDGNVQGTPESYGPVGVYEDGMTIVNLRVVSDYVARIDWFYYSTLQSAFDACNASENNTEQTTVHMIKDIILNDTVISYMGQNIRLNLNGYMLTNSNNTILNVVDSSNLEITDLTKEQSGKIKSSIAGTGSSSSNMYKVIINNGYLNISGGMILSQQNYNYPIYNEKGVIEVTGGKIDSQNGKYYTYGIYNSRGTIIIRDGKINVLGDYSAYGIYNYLGQAEINGGTIICNTNATNYNYKAYGIYNNDTGTINIHGGTIDVSDEESDSGAYYYGIYNSNGIINIENALINVKNRSSYGVCNKNGEVNVLESTINCNEYGLYNGEGIITVLGGTINSVTYGIMNAGTGIIEMSAGFINTINESTNTYGIYNKVDGTIKMTGGEIKSKGTGFSSDVYGIYNESDGAIEIINGNVSSECNGGSAVATAIYNRGTGIIKITGGNINSTSNYRYDIAYGIYNYDNGTIIIGNKEESIDTYNPNISCTYDIDTELNKAYGIFNRQFGKIYFYDGIIQSTRTLLYGGITEIENNCEIIEDMQGKYKRIYLNRIEDNNFIVENIVTKKQYTNINEAIMEITQNENELKLLADFTLVSNFTIPEKVEVKLDLNGKKISNRYFQISNYGRLEISSNIEGGKIENQGTTILNLNQGNLYLKSGEIEGKTLDNITNTTYGIYNDTSGELAISGGNVNSTSLGGAYGIYNNRGTVLISNAKISSTSTSDDYAYIYGISNGTEGIVEIVNGEVIATNKTDATYTYGISNSGKVKISDSVITSDTGRYAYGISNSSEGTLEIIKSEVNSFSTGDGFSDARAIANSGIATIAETQINSSCESLTYGIYNGKILNLIGGKISSIGKDDDNVYGIYNSSGTVTVGTKNDGIVSSAEPYIYAIYTGTSEKYGGYGVYNKSGIFNFYDGKIEGSTRAVTEDSLITEVEETQTPQYSEDYKIYAYGLEATDVAKIGDKTYSNLQDAIDEATETDIIEILRGIQYTNQDVTLTILSGKNITIDLQNHPIISEIEAPVFSVEGKLKIIDTVEGENGKITSSYKNTIYIGETGILETNSGIITNNRSGNNVIENEGTINMTGGTISQSYSGGYAINNNDTGVINIFSGIIDANECTIYNTGKIYVTGGTITGSDNAITNTGLGILNIEGGTIKTTYYSSIVIKNEENANINMSGGEIVVSAEHQPQGINNTSTGSINITKGRVTAITTSTGDSYNAYGIYSTAGTMNIGTKDGNINSETPNILGTTNGVYVSTNCTLNIYDGIIKGEETAISGNITSLEEQSEIVVGEETDEDNNTYETVSLVKVDLPIASVDVTQYYSLKDAIDNINGTGTVQILKNGVIGETINIPSDKNITIDLNGNTLNMYTQFENNGTLNITDTNLSSSGILTGYKDRVINNNGNLTVSGGTISEVTYGIYNNNGGTTNISGGTLSNNQYGIYNVSGGTVNITNGTITGNTYGTFNYGGDINVSGGNINGNEYGVYNSTGTTNISNLTITGNTTEVANGGTGTTNILSGNIISNTIAVTNTSSGRINIGSQDLAVDKENPVIQGEQYGIANTGTGSIAFYDGIVKGKEGSIQGYYLYTETGYTAQTNVVDGYYCDTLALSGTVTTVAKIGDIEYTNLQSAINACTSDTPTTITLVNSINSTQIFTIEEGQNVIIDLNGSTIATGTLEKLIENTGTLTIIDTNDRQTGKISNTSGIAINNTGTLNLGQDDGTVSTTCPEVVGKSTGIVNTGTFNFYDGIIKGAEALSGNVTARPDGYVINSSTDEATGMKQLTLGR